MYEYIDNFNYSYAPFRGKDFLKDYFKLRKKKIKESKGYNKRYDVKAKRSNNFLLLYLATGNFKFLNKALKLNDTICSRAKITKACGEVLEFEINLISKLLEKEGIKL